jgi:hypothetical protein
MIAWLVIGWISAIDVYWSIKVQHVLLSSELNPVGRWLIRQDGGSIALFMGLKCAGLVTVLGILVLLRFWRIQVAQKVIWTLFVLQVMLLWFLNQ